MSEKSQWEEAREKAWKRHGKDDRPVGSRGLARVGLAYLESGRLGTSNGMEWGGVDFDFFDEKPPVPDL